MGTGVQERGGFHTGKYPGHQVWTSTDGPTSGRGGSRDGVKGRIPTTFTVPCREPTTDRVFVLTTPTTPGKSRRTPPLSVQDHRTPVHTSTDEQYRDVPECCDYLSSDESKSLPVSPVASEGSVDHLHTRRTFRRLPVPSGHWNGPDRPALPVPRRKTRRSLPGRRLRVPRDPRPRINKTTAPTAREGHPKDYLTKQ